MVGREEDGLERSLVEAARRKDEVGRDVDLHILSFRPAHFIFSHLSMSCQLSLEF